jgi:hypothetical protein
MFSGVMPSTYGYTYAGDRYAPRDQGDLKCFLQNVVAKAMTSLDVTSATTEVMVGLVVWTISTARPHLPSLPCPGLVAVAACQELVRSRTQTTQAVYGAYRQVVVIPHSSRPADLRVVKEMVWITLTPWAAYRVPGPPTVCPSTRQRLPLFLRNIRQYAMEDRSAGCICRRFRVALITRRILLERRRWGVCRGCRRAGGAEVGGE